LVSLTDVVSGQDKPAGPPVSDCNHRVTQGQKVIRRLINELDSNVEPAVREKIMQNCGRACFEGAHGKRAAEAPKPEDVVKFMDGMKKYLGEEGIKQEGDQMVVYFKYTANPRGLKVADGYCLCPIVEDAPKDISPTYCLCSVGYVREMFEQRIGKPVRVELIDSVLRGGKGCNFKVSFKA
jgi:predicted hydrocarbon binding protein